MDTNKAIQVAFRDCKTGNLLQAEKICNKILKRKPKSAEALYILGISLHQRGQHDDAISCLRKALKHNPYFADVYNQLGIVYITKGQPDDALICFREAIRLRPNLAEPHYNLGLVLKDRGELSGSVGCFRKAIQINPDFIQAHWSLSHVLLLSGDFREGWKEYEWRWRTEDFMVNQSGLPHPLWKGFDITGQTILLQAEQGFGDTIQFIRYAPMVSERCAKVLVGCHKELKSILQSVEGVTGVIAYGEMLPEFDVRCRLLSLPLIFDTTLHSIPARIAYIKADTVLSQRWRDMTQFDRSKLKIGLAWAGSPEHKKDHMRSCSLEMFSTLAHSDKITFYSLQKGGAAEQSQKPPERMNFIDLTDEIHDFSDTAALMENLDLIISVDTAAAHLAGALGKPVWILLPFAPDWRWMSDRSDSPWYPTMRLFRQPAPGDWGSVITQVSDELRRKLIGITA